MCVVSCIQVNKTDDIARIRDMAIGRSMHDLLVLRRGSVCGT